MKKLNLDFYRRDTKKVARELIGKVLVHRREGVITSGLITETEAYLGIKDSAAHTYQGRRTDRVASMYLDGGHSYVYFIYGIHFCFNVVTQDESKPEAVLIRALEPLRGVAVMRARRKLRAGRPDRDLCSGPGKLCLAMGIDRSCNGLRLNGAELWIEENQTGSKVRITAGPRVGVDYATEPKHRPARDWPLRFQLRR
ncbi:DNA-3-methyladenine glycosylase [soil metagenome]